MELQLTPSQRDAVKRMHNGCVLAADTGVGKSITGLAYYYCKVCGYSMKTMCPYDPAKKPLDLYVISTAQKRDNREWEFEVNKFGFNLGWNEHYGVNVKIDSWNNIAKYKTVTGAFFIFDEQHTVKATGVWSKAFIEIAKHNQWILMSATPGDNWEQYAAIFIANGFYKNITQFKRMHEIEDPFYHKPIDWVNTKLLYKCRDATFVVMERERSFQYHDIDIWVPYDKPTYKKIFKERFDYENDRPYRNAQELCAALRRVVNSEGLRLVEVERLAVQHPKVIIFYNYNFELDLLLQCHFPKGTEIAQWNGRAHEPIPDSERWVYLVQYNAGSEGWNCVQTDTIIFYSNNYSYKTMKQAKGRIDRKNSPFSDLYYYTIKSRAPLDIAIERAINEKSKFNAEAFCKRK